MKVVISSSCERIKLNSPTENLKSGKYTTFLYTSNLQHIRREFAQLSPINDVDLGPSLLTLFVTLVVNLNFYGCSWGLGSGLKHCMPGVPSVREGVYNMV